MASFVYPPSTPPQVISPYSGRPYVGTLLSIHKGTRNQIGLPTLPRVWSPVLKSSRLRRARRHGYFMVIAMIRMRRMAKRATLFAYENNALVRLYQNAGAMQSARELVDLFSSLGLSASHDDMETWLTQELHFTGGVIRWNHFKVICQMLKASYIRDSEVPDSHIAFVALGGGSNLEGEVKAEVLRDVVQHVGLTIDIDAFIREADSDGSGLLEYDEFEALFIDDKDTDTAGAAGGVGAGSSAGGASAANAPPSDMQRAKSMQAKRTSISQAVMEIEDEVDGNAALQQEKPVVRKEVTAATVLQDISDLLERPPPTPTFVREVREAKKKAKVKERKKTLPKTERRFKLWEKGGEEEAKDKLVASRKQEKCSGQFGSSRRFDFDEPLQPLPPTRGTHTPRPYRPNFRDGQWNREAFSESKTKRGQRHEDAPPPKTSRLPDINGGRMNNTKTAWYDFNPFFAPPANNNNGDGSGINDAKEKKERGTRLPPIAKKKKRTAGDDVQKQDTDAAEDAAATTATQEKKEADKEQTALSRSRTPSRSPSRSHSSRHSSRSRSRTPSRASRSPSRSPTPRSQHASRSPTPPSKHSSRKSSPSRSPTPEKEDSPAKQSEAVESTAPEQEDGKQEEQQQVVKTPTPPPSRKKTPTPPPKTPTPPPPRDSGAATPVDDPIPTKKDEEDNAETQEEEVQHVQSEEKKTSATTDEAPPSSTELTTDEAPPSSTEQPKQTDEGDHRGTPEQQEAPQEPAGQAEAPTTTQTETPVSNGGTGDAPQEAQNESTPSTGDAEGTGGDNPTGATNSNVPESQEAEKKDGDDDDDSPAWL